MDPENNIINLLLDNLRKIFFPEEWIQLDLAVSKTELLAMLIVDRHGEVIMSQIADNLNVPLSTATGLVNRLVKNGYLLRERSEEDRRIVAIQLTERGKSLVHDLKSTLKSYLERVNVALTDEERRVLFGVFQKIIEILNQENRAGAEETAGQTLKSIPIE